jgi:gas vesicle protein
MDQLDFLKGAVIGGCVGAVAALFLAPKSGRDLRHDITEGYNTINKKSHQYANDFTGRAQGLFNSLQGIEEEQHESSNTFLIGGAVGAVIGALAGLLLAPQAGEKLRDSLGDEYENICDKAKSVVNDLGKKEQDFEDKLDEWKDVFSTVVDKLSSSLNKKGNHGQGRHLDKILDWATLGLRLYNKVQARR